MIRKNNPIEHEKIKPGQHVVVNDDQTVTIFDEEEREVTTIPAPTVTAEADSKASS